jgi:hypothetical protein
MPRVSLMEDDAKQILNVKYQIVICELQITSNQLPMPFRYNSNEN